MKLLTWSHPRLVDIAILLIRCTIGIILFVIGAGKVLGLFGGMGLAQTVQAFGKMGFSPFLVYLSCFTEFIGGFLIIIGFGTRIVAFPVIVNMAVATITLLPKGFFLGGAAYPFLILISTIAILLTGPGAYSFDLLLYSSDEYEFTP